MRYLTLFLFSLLLFSSCKIYRSNLMLRTPKDFSYDQLIDSLSRLDYRIAPNDALQYRIFTNNGYKLIDLASTSVGSRNDLDVIVNSQGNIKMPLIGLVHVAGFTMQEAENILEKMYGANTFVDPFVNIRVTNKRVIVFPGNGGGAKVVPMLNNNTTVIEAIATAGGIMEDGKAYKVKLIRSNPDPNQRSFVYLMDLSRIEGVTVANSRVQAGDIIYVEPRYKPVATVIREITPALTLITTMLILYEVFHK